MMKCKCGHAANRHEMEMPYPCYECDCKSFINEYDEDDDDTEE